MKQNAPLFQSFNDDELLNLMKSSKTVYEWNENRELIKQVREINWINKNIDSIGLIGKTKIKSRQIIIKTKHEN